MRIDLGDDEQPEIGLIALIDCVFFLLMFFMVATSFKHAAEGKPQKELPITLPQSAISLDKSRASGDPLVIGVDAKGGLYWGREPVTTAVLRERLHAEAVRDRDQPVRIDGDTRVPYQDIVHLLDLCQFEGMTHIAMHTRAGAASGR
jgi:biopolymer transport protein ExbD